MIRLYGSFTSPFVRRVRYVAQILGLTYQQIDTMTEKGQAELRSKTPLWKVPFVEVDGIQLWDSHAIIDYLIEKNGTGDLRIPSDSEKWRESNILHAIDTAVESSINVFYLSKDGITASQSSYIKKQQDRVHSILEWVKTNLRGNHFTSDKRMGLTELALFTSLDWMQFRNTYPVATDPVWSEFLEFHSQDENLRNTKPS